MPSQLIARKSCVSVAAQQQKQLPKAAPVKKPAPQQKVNKFMPAIAAGLAAVTLASPALAGEVNVEDLRKTVCAANPTAKICLQDSAKRT